MEGGAVIAVEPTTDEAYIRAAFLSPEIYAQMSDDSCPPASALDMGALKSIPGFFLRVLLDGVASGCWWLIWKGDTVEAHTALLGECRGRKAITATKQAIRWVFENTGARAITSYAWSDSPAVRFFCRAVGMSETETKPWAATRGGKPVTITYYSIPREAVI
jgi:hypothetical protein